ncbi:MAG: TIGR03067 domain-containing protein [Gemmataceae bacterium]
MQREQQVAQAEPQKKAADAGLQELQGTWRIVSSQVGDEKASEDEVRRRKVTVKDNVFTYDFGNERKEKRQGTIKLDTKTKPLDWTVTLPEAATALAIYDLKGDDWKIGFGNDGLVRPRQFVMGKDDVVWLLVLKREQREGKAKRAHRSWRLNPGQGRRKGGRCFQGTRQVEGSLVMRGLRTRWRGACGPTGEGGPVERDTVVPRQHAQGPPILEHQLGKERETNVGLFTPSKAKSSACVGVNWAETDLQA